jgi:hypothetical protein
MQDAEPLELATAPDWTPWGRPRRTGEGVETAFHHPLLLIREGGGVPRVVRPGDVFVGEGAQVEWSPMLWALDGRRPGRSAGSLEVSRAFLGEGDRLFTTINRVCEQLFEGGGFGLESCGAWVGALAARLAFCEARGIVYRHLVVPEGHAIYADAIPGRPCLSPDRPLARVLAAADARLRAAFVYPLDALMDGRAQEETALPHDIHVSRYGAFLIYRALMASLPMIAPSAVLQAEDLTSRIVLLAGDVARAAGQRGRRVKMHEPPHVAMTPLVKGDTYRTYQVDVLEGEDKSLPCLVMFRTSNASQLFPFLMRHFSRIAAVASTEAFYDLIESERPAVVVGEMPERYFAPHRPNGDITDFGAPPYDLTDAFERLTGHKLPLPGAI